jgi:hypothetical protein
MATCQNIAVAVLALVGGVMAQEQDKTSRLSQFEEQVAGYIKLRKLAVSQAPKVKSTSSAQKLAEAKKALASSIVNARPNATQGVIFTPQVAAEFRSLAKAATKGSDGVRVRKSLKHAEPTRVIAVRVNDSFPLPLQSMPPTLLMHLPQLPMELEYRLVGRTLVLRDSQANLVVDFLPEAIP